MYNHSFINFLIPGRKPKLPEYQHQLNQPKRKRESK